jgi:hypothetical protein
VTSLLGPLPDLATFKRRFSSSLRASLLTWAPHVRFLVPETQLAPFVSPVVPLSSPPTDAELLRLRTRLVEYEHAVLLISEPPEAVNAVWTQPPDSWHTAKVSVLLTCVSRRLRVRPA